jgi:Ca-activated chloride channel family protein
MTFAWPHLLWLLALPAGLLAWELFRKRGLAGGDHPKILRAEAGMTSVSLTEFGVGKPPSSRRRFLLCAGIALGVVALARPQWGRIDEPVFDQSRDIIIALDLSRSMLTPDVKPSRLERSKLLIQSLLDKLKGERVGLIVFSGTAFLQSPISSDYEILREFLPALGPDYLPEGGTNYRQLIDTALDAFAGGSAADRYLIILSDGEATDDNWKDRVPELAKRGIRVIGLGVGTASGGMIPDGAGAFMKDENGAVVLSKLESGTLRELAEATHGVYRDASEWVDLSKVLASTVDEGRKGRFVEKNSVRYAERYQWALAQALVCLLASFWLEFPVRPKSRDIRLSAPPAPARRAASAVAAAFLAALLLFSGASALAADAAAPDPAAALSKIVGRLSAQDACSALDWAELGRETVTWGEHVKSGNQEVPEGPVHDALRAVDDGEKSDAKATDWPKMRSELEDLLKKPENKNQNQNQQDQQNKDQNKDQDKKQDQKQDNKQDQKQQQDDKAKQQNKDQQGSQPQSDKQDSKDQGGQQQSKPADQKQGGQSAFGDMSKDSPAAPTPTPRRESQGSMQKVGGVKKGEPDDPARANPELAVPLEKLEQLKNQDSPAELFGMLRRGEPTPTPANTGKNW